MKPWQIDYNAENWECDWEGNKRQELRYFRQFSLHKKLEIVEGLCNLARYFQKRREAEGKPYILRDR